MALQDKVVLITGGGRGIGKAAVARFAAEGAKVAFCARSEGELFGVAKEIEGAEERLRPFRADISSRREVQRMVSQVTSEWGKIDLLINNAGVLGPSEPIATYPPEAWEEVIRININGTFLVTQAVVRTMIPQRSGTVVSVTSSVGRKGRAGWGAYAVSKFGLEGMMQTLADEVAPFGLRVVTLNPGGTRTRMRAAAYPKEDPARLQAPERVANGLLYLAVSSDPTLHGKSLDLADLPV
ncbi:MAG TPA: SDR family NAD(P)-dependent oxidoreductase [Candidatus Manganitrophaceae bacterium]|nr:SDR family NAD(P)-dependent oxidoreductase [Candidatus Manganitrophaceae bacterium]